MPPRKVHTSYQVSTILRRVFITLHKKYFHSVERIASVAHPVFLFMLMSPSLDPCELKRALDAYMATTYIRETKREALDLSMLMNTLCVHLELTVKCGQCHRDQTSFYVKKQSRMVECEKCHFRDAVTEASWVALKANICCLRKDQLMQSTRGEVYANRNGGLQAFFRQGHMCLYNSTVLGIQEQMLQQDQEITDLECDEDLQDLCRTREPRMKTETTVPSEHEKGEAPLLALPSHPFLPPPLPPPPSPFASLNPNCLLSHNDCYETPLFESGDHDFSVIPLAGPGFKRNRESNQKECFTPESSSSVKRPLKKQCVSY